MAAPAMFVAVVTKTGLVFVLDRDTGERFCLLKSGQHLKSP